MAKKRKSIVKKIAENRKVRRFGIIIAVILAVVCLGSALFENVFRAKVSIEGFDKKYIEVSNGTRDALESELEQFVYLNTGENQSKARFVLREDSDGAINEDEDDNKSTAFYIDSEDLQISALVQIVWRSGFTNPNSSFIARVDCATDEMSKFEASHCYSLSTGAKTNAFRLDNLELLKTYGVSADAISNAQNEMLNYLKIAYPEAEKALIVRKSIRTDDAGLHADLTLEDKQFELIVTTDNDWQIELRSGENIIWSGHAGDEVTHYRHYLTLKKQLPVEMETVSGTVFALRFEDKNHLVINSASCADGEKNQLIEQTARDWLKANDFDPNTYEIKLKINCES